MDRSAKRESLKSLNADLASHCPTSMRNCARNFTIDMSSDAKDDSLAKRLWVASEELTGVRYRFNEVRAAA